jgi:hypothetical protein
VNLQGKTHESVRERVLKRGRRDREGIPQTPVSLWSFLENRSLMGNLFYINLRAGSIIASQSAFASLQVYSTNQVD